MLQKTAINKAKEAIASKKSKNAEDSKQVSEDKADYDVVKTASQVKRFIEMNQSKGIFELVHNYTDELGDKVNILEIVTKVNEIFCN